MTRSAPQFTDHPQTPPPPSLKRRAPSPAPVNGRFQGSGRWPLVSFGWRRKASRREDRGKKVETRSAPQFTNQPQTPPPPSLKRRAPSPAPVNGRFQGSGLKAAGLFRLAHESIAADRLLQMRKARAPAPPLRAGGRLRRPPLRAGGALRPLGLRPRHSGLGLRPRHLLSACALKTRQGATAGGWCPRADALRVCAARLRA